MKRNIILLASLLVVGNVYALPQCPSSGVWHNCFGAYTFDDGDEYVGEWKEDQLYGHGTYTWANGDKYIGEFRNGRTSYGVQYSALDRLQGTYSNGEWCEECEPTANQLALVREIDPSLITTVSEEQSTDLAQFLSDANRTQDHYRKCNAWFYSGRFEYDNIIFENWADVLDRKFTRWGRQSDVASELSHLCAPFLDSTGLVWIAPSRVDDSGEERQRSTTLPSCPASGYFDNCFGTYTYDEGDQYVGEWKDDKMHGHGTYTFGPGEFEGDKYVGEFKGSKFHGHGTYTYDEGDKYVGEYKDGKQHGHATYTFGPGKFEGDKYVGEYRDGKFHGHGTYIRADGGVYVGEYKHGKPWQGVEYSSSGKVKGTYSNGEACGDCEPTASQLALVREIDPSHVVAALPSCPASGYFDNCFGTYTYDEGDQYVGEWKDDKMHGHGTYTFGPGELQGDKYIGEWEHGKPWQGVEYSSSGKVKGAYSNGEACGDCEPTASQLALVREIDPSHIVGSDDSCASEPDSAACEKTRSGSESKSRLIGTGTGFAVNPDYVVTADHVLEGCNEVTIVHSHQETAAQTVARDRSNDLGLLRLDKKFLHAAKLRGGSSIRLGERVSNYGYPLFGDISTSATITEGNINNLSGAGNDSTVLQFDAPTQPGNSGGPVLDSSGNVVGVAIEILSKKYADATGHIAQNVNFAVKSNIVENFLSSNKVSFEKADSTEELKLPDIAEKAETFTVLVGCWE